MPVLVVTGDLDVPHMLSLARALVDRLPDVTDQVVADTAHLPQLERPDTVADLVRDFLERVDS